MKPFEIFRTGRHTPMKGDPIEFGESDLTSVASGYDTAKHHAPIVIGHPKTDGPAFGWVDKVEFADGRLVVTPADLAPEFSELVTAKRFRKVSAAFYAPNSPGNPTPGAYYLRHVGFLGAQPPAVKGLKEIEFADAGDEVIVEFADEWVTSSIASSAARLFRGVRDWFVQEKGVDVADELMPEWEIENLTRSSIRAEPDPARFAEPDPKRKDMTPTPSPDAADLKRREDALAASEAAFAERQAKTRATEDAAFVASLVEKGTVPKALGPAATALFSELDEDVLEFGEGDDATKTTPRAAFRDFLSRLPVPAVTGEMARGADDGPDFSDPAETADYIRTEIAAAAKEGETISSAQAMERLKQKAAK